MKITLEEAFEILGVTNVSSDEEIKASYRRLALQTHPDKNRDDPVAHQKFLKVSEAYRRIIDPQLQGDEMEEDMMGDEDYDDDDYETMFAFRMFERMFSFGTGVGVRADRRNACHCWECRNSKNFFIPKPQTKYIPKSQRPKDPKEEAKKQQIAKAANPHEDWLSDEEAKVKPRKGGVAAGSKKAVAAAAGSKKKNSKKSADVFSYLIDGEHDSKSEEARADDKNSSHHHHAQGNQHNKKPNNKAHKKEVSSSESSEESDDEITAEEMVARMRGVGAPALGKVTKGKQANHNIPNQWIEEKSAVDMKTKSAASSSPTRESASIAPSLPKQPAATTKNGSKGNPVLCLSAMPIPPVSNKDRANAEKYKSQMGALSEMGFDSNSAVRALTECNGDLEVAMNILLLEGAGGQNDSHHQPQTIHVSSLSEVRGGHSRDHEAQDSRQQHQVKTDTFGKHMTGGNKAAPGYQHVVASKPQPGAQQLHNSRQNDLPPPVMMNVGHSGAGSHNSYSQSGANQTAYRQYDSQMQALSGMGFSATVSMNALEKCNGNLKDAASLLLFSPDDSVSLTGASPRNGSFPPPVQVNAAPARPAWGSGDSSALPHSQFAPLPNGSNSAPPGLPTPASAQRLGLGSNDPPPRSRGPATIPSSVPLGLSNVPTAPGLSMSEPAPRSRGPTVPPPPIIPQQGSSDLGFDFGSLNDFGAFGSDALGSSGTSRLLGSGSSRPVIPSQLSHSLGQGVPSSPQHSSSFPASILIQSSSSDNLAQHVQSGLDGGLSGSTEPFMMYGNDFQNGFSSGFNSGGLMGSLGGNTAADLSGSANLFSGGRVRPTSDVADAALPNALPMPRDIGAGFSGFQDSLFGDNFTESVANAVIGSHSSLNDSVDMPSGSILGGLGGHRQSVFGNEPELFGNQSTPSSYASLLGGSSDVALESSSAPSSSFSYALAVAAAAGPTSNSASVPVPVVSLNHSPTLSSGVGGQTFSAASGNSGVGGAPLTNTGYMKGYKSKACVFFQSPKGCARGDKCTFAHVPDNVAPSQISNNKSYYQQQQPKR